MSHLEILIRGLGHLLSHYGGWGLFAISFLDSSFLAFPFINDLLLIELASAQPHKAALFGAQCTAGSVLGALTIYYITRQGRNLFSRRTTKREKTRIRRWIEQNDFLAILTASLLPPPAPFKVFAIVAGALQINLVRFILALIVGRGIRFAFEAWLGAYYGISAQAYLRNNIGWVSLVIVAVVIAGAIIHRYYRRLAAKGDE
ncbi:MAG: DedA family protein [Acidobacteriota bacterium]|nr:DedA family protein [Acidobacteriota bacterium]